MTSGDRSPASRRRDAASRRETVRAAIDGTISPGPEATAGVADGSGATSGGDTPPLAVDGNRIRDPTGRAVTLRGVNIADPRRTNETAESRGKTAPQVVDYLTSAERGWHPRTIRVPCQPQDVAGKPSPWDAHHDGLDPDGYVDFEDHVGYYEPGIFDRDQLLAYCEQHLDPVVERCAERGVYCIVDYHRHWGDGELEWADPETGEPNEALSAEVTLFWDVVAERYAGLDNVLFEVYNEPTLPGMWGDPLETEWVAETWGWWLDTAQPWVDRIREHAPENVVIVGSPGWSQSPEGVLLEPFEGENLAYSYHVYPHHGASDRGDWEDASETAMGEGVMGVHEEVPLFVTEWGWFADDCGEEPGVLETYGVPLVEWMEEHGLHWQAWGFDAEWGGDVAIRRAFDGDCADLPCEWEVVPGEESLGRFVRNLLYAFREDGVPAE